VECCGELLLGLPPLPLGTYSLGDVVTDDGDRDDVAHRVVDRGHRERHVE